MRASSLSAVIILLICLGLAPAVQAFSIVNGQSTEGIGAYQAFIDYEPVPESGGTKALLTVSIANLTDPTLGGYITGFALNNPGGRIQKVELGAGFPVGFQLLGPSVNNLVKASPYGFFDFGAALGGNLLGGGSPVAGIAVGDNKAFTFILTGQDLDLLDPYSFRDEFSALGKKDNAGGFFVVRFKGFANGDSDKALGLGEWLEE